MAKHVWCLLTAAVAGLVLASSASAGDKGLYNKEAFSSFEFNFTNPGARSLGMGGAFVAVADDATAAVANPAGLVILQRPELSAEVKFTRFHNTYRPFSNTEEEGARNVFHSRDFDDNVVTPSFFSFVYPTERLVVAAFVRELVNFKSTIESPGVFFADPSTGDLVRFLPFRTKLRIEALDFGLGGGLHLEKTHPLLPNIGASVEFSIGRIRSDLDRFDFGGARIATETVDGTDIGIGFTVGALWRPVRNLAIGAVHRRGPRYDMSGTATFVGGDTVTFPFGFKVPDVSAVGASYRFFDRLTIGFEATYVQYSQLVKNFQAIFADSIATKYRVDDALELHLGGEYIFFVGNIPLAVRAGFFTDPDHTIRYTGGAHDTSEAGERVLYQRGKDHYHGTAGFGVVLRPGFQIDFAANYSTNIREFSVSTVFRF
jgi:long-subunit fatty acid transport protein